MNTTEDLGVRQLGEIPFDFTYRFLDSEGAPIDITGWSAVCTVVAPDGTSFAAAASVIDGPDGRVARAWTSSMTDQAGEYRSTITVTDGTYKQTSRRLEWIVETHP